MDNHKSVEEFILGLPNTKLTFPFGEDVSVYKVFIPDKTFISHADDTQETDKQSNEAYTSTVNESEPSSDAVDRSNSQQELGSDKLQAEKVRGEWKMFALMPEKKTPVNLSLKCDPQLAKVLRERYESVMEGYHLNKKHWNTLLLTGQLTDSEVKDLILHSYNLVTGNGGSIDFKIS